MPRSISSRGVQEPSLFVEYSPVEASGRSIEKVLLTLDEFETSRTADFIRGMNCGYMFKTNIGIKFTKCPESKFTSLQNLAGGIGHVKC